MKHLFSGGVHPDGRKSLAPPSPVHSVEAPALAVVPLRQHIGAPCAPLVQPGGRVKKGQKIGDGEGLCVPVHAPVSGTVRGVERWPHPALGTCEVIVIENDFLDTPAPPLEAPAAPSDLARVVREAGVAGMGGAAFSTAVKIASSAGAAKTLIVNTCECEPYVNADNALVCEQAELVMQGARRIAAAVGAKDTVAAVEDDKPRAAVALRRAAALTDARVAVLPARYPQGSEKQLIRAVTGREAGYGRLPRDVGCAVFNAATCAAVERAARGEPLVERIVTVSGRGVKKPGNFRARIGTPVSALIDAAGGMTENAVRVVAGGPMMGFALEDLGAPVTKGLNAVLCLTADECPDVRATACIRCGRCAEVCPMRLLPLELFRAESCGDLASMTHYHVCDCIECGCCAYVCPAKLPLVRSVRAAKRIVKECDLP